MFRYNIPSLPSFVHAHLSLASCYSIINCRPTNPIFLWYILFWCYFIYYGYNYCFTLRNWNIQNFNIITLFRYRSVKISNLSNFVLLIIIANVSALSYPILIYYHNICSIIYSDNNFGSLILSNSYWIKSFFSRISESDKNTTAIIVSRTKVLDHVPVPVAVAGLTNQKVP